MAHQLSCIPLIHDILPRSPVTHRMAPWVHRVFIELLPRVLCLERPKKEDKDDDVLTDVFQVPPDLDKFTDYGTKRFSGEYGIPGTCQCHCHLICAPAK